MNSQPRAYMHWGQGIGGLDLLSRRTSSMVVFVYPVAYKSTPTLGGGGEMKDVRCMLRTAL